MGVIQFFLGGFMKYRSKHKSPQKKSILFFWGHVVTLGLPDSLPGFAMGTCGLFCWEFWMKDTVGFDAVAFCRAAMPFGLQDLMKIRTARGFSA